MAWATVMRGVGIVALSMRAAWDRRFKHVFGCGGYKYGKAIQGAVTPRFRGVGKDSIAGAGEFSLGSSARPRGRRSEPMNATLLLILLAFLSIYSYCVYPLVLLAARKLAGRSGPAADADPGPREAGAAGAPRMSLIITAHNESERIRAKLENSLSLAYDPGRLEILVASDA